MPLNFFLGLQGLYFTDAKPGVSASLWCLDQHIFGYFLIDKSHFWASSDSYYLF